MDCLSNDIGQWNNRVAFDFIIYCCDGITVLTWVGFSAICNGVVIAYTISPESVSVEIVDSQVVRGIRYEAVQKPDGSIDMDDVQLNT